jgi:hypothetical protein
VKFQINVPLLDLDDKTPITSPPLGPADEPKPMQIADVIIRSLKNGDPNEGADIKYETYKLARRAQRANDSDGLLELSSTEVQKVRNAVAKQFFAVPFGRVADLLENPLPPPGPAG